MFDEKRKHHNTGYQTNNRNLFWEGSKDFNIFWGVGGGGGGGGGLEDVSKTTKAPTILSNTLNEINFCYCTLKRRIFC